MSKKDSLKKDFNDKLWLKAYPEGVKWDAELKGMPMGEMFDESVKKYGDRPFLDFMGRKYTFKEAGKIVDRLAANMQHEHGIGKGNRVALALPNTQYYVFAYFAAMKAGATVVNLNPLYAEEEMIELCKDAKVDMLFTMDAKTIYPTIEKIKERANIKTVVVCSLADALPGTKKYALKAFNPVAKLSRKLGGPKKLSALEKLATVKHKNGTIRFSKMLKKPKSPAVTPKINPGKDVALFQYTGGTTGLPKAAMLTHSNITVNVEQLRMWFTTMKPEGEKMLAVLPFFHVFAMTAEMNLAMRCGHEIILMPEPNIPDILKTIEKQKITIFAGVPKLYQEIIKANKDGKYDLSSLRTCIAGGAALDPSVKKEFEDLFTCKLVEGYGLSETSPLVSANPLSGLNKAGSIGLVVPGTEIKLRDLDDPAKTVAQGEKGEICIRGPQVMKGYHNNAAATAESIDKDGWFATGDVGVMDENGYVSIVDRIKDMILTNNGLNVYPGKVEQALMQHPDIAEVIVLGVKNDQNGQDIKAFIVLKPGSEEFDRPALKEFLKDKLSPYEMPRLLDFRADLPKTMIGKPDKKALRAEEEAKASNDNKTPKKPAAKAAKK